MKKIFLILIPFILSIGLVFPFSYAVDYDLECPENKVIIVRTTNPNPICVYDSTAQRWVEMGMAEFVISPSIDDVVEEKIIDDLPEKTFVDDIPVDASTLPDVLGSFAEAISDFHYDNIPDELSRAQSYLVTFSNGDFTEQLTIQTFSKVDPGDGSHILTSFQESGFDTYFSLASTHSMDKIEFYNLVAKSINPGKSPELFDVTVDVLAGDNSVIVSTNYSKCNITGYLPYTQDFLLFYQFSDMLGSEIRDKTTIYCNGVDLVVHNDDHEKIISNELLPYIPSSDESIRGYIVHFSGPNFEGLNTVETFSDFSPSINFIESPYDIIIIPGNPLDSTPQFFLESLPSVDKLELYKYYAMYVNPGTPPDPVDVSIDLITGNGTVLQRWNYNDCSFYDYTSFLEDSFLKFSYAEKPGPEIRDKSEFTCAGYSLEISGDDSIPKFPIRDAKNNEQKSDISPTVPKIDDRADSFRISVYDGEFVQTHSSENLQKYESLRKDRGPLTPLNHAKQFDYGFTIESLPEKDKAAFYEFISRYVNSGKSPEPFDVSLDMLTGTGDILYENQYTNCGAIDFLWYLQQGAWVFQFSEAEDDGEIRKKYIFYCEGYGINFPE